MIIISQNPHSVWSDVRTTKWKFSILCCGTRYFYRYLCCAVSAFKMILKIGPLPLTGLIYILTLFNKTIFTLWARVFNGIPLQDLCHIFGFRCSFPFVCDTLKHQKVTNLSLTWIETFFLKRLNHKQPLYHVIGIRHIGQLWYYMTVPT